MNDLITGAIILATAATSYMMFKDNTNWSFSKVRPSSVRFVNYHYIFDIRSGDEYAEAHIIDPRVRHIEGLEQYPSRIVNFNIPICSKVLLMCNTGNRASIAATGLKKLGYCSLSILDGNILNIPDTTYSF